MIELSTQQISVIPAEPGWFADIPWRAEPGVQPRDETETCPIIAWEVEIGLNSKGEYEADYIPVGITGNTTPMRLDRYAPAQWENCWIALRREANP